MAQYMKIDAIKGNVTAKGYDNTIEIMSATQQGMRPIQQNIGTPNHDMGLLDLHHMQVSKLVDSASPMLWHYFYTGKMIPKVEIIQCTVSNGVPQWRTKTTLYNVLISSMQDQGNADGANELMSIAYTKVERSYRQQSASGQWASPKHISFDLSTARAG